MHSCPSFERPPARVSLIAGAAACALLAGAASAQVVHDPGYTLSLELAGLNNPQGIDTDAAGNVYVTDSGNGRILRGQGGSYAPIITGIAVSPFVGLDIGPLSVLIAPDQCESRHEVMALAREAAGHAREQPGSSMVVDQQAAGTSGIASAA